MVSLHSSDFMVSVWKRKLLWRKYPGNDDTPAYCPDVSLPITGLKKRSGKFSGKFSLKLDYLQRKLDDAKTSSNCVFLTPNKTNLEVWTILSRLHRTFDCKYQDIYTSDFYTLCC